MFGRVSNQGADALDEQPEALRRMVLGNAIAGGELTRRYYSLIDGVIARCIPGARMVIVPEVTRLMSYQNPPAFDEALLRSLARYRGGMADKAGSATHSGERKMTVTEDTGMMTGLPYSC